MSMSPLALSGWKYKRREWVPHTFSAFDANTDVTCKQLHLVPWIPFMTFTLTQTQTSRANSPLLLCVEIARAFPLSFSWLPGFPHARYKKMAQINGCLLCISVQNSVTVSIISKIEHYFQPKQNGAIPFISSQIALEVWKFAAINVCISVFSGSVRLGDEHIRMYNSAQRRTDQRPVPAV